MVSHMDALLIHLGTGRWSILHFIIMGYTSVFLPPHSLGGAFLAPRLDYFCRVPSSSNFGATNVSVLLQQNSSFFSSDSSLESTCEYQIDTPEGVKTEECVEFDFDNSTFSSTLTSEYNLACDRAYLQTSFQSLYMFGVFVGAPINGYLADKYGRKSMAMFGYIGYMMLGMASAWLPLLSTILVSRFLMGYLNAVCAFSSYVLLAEVLVPKMRILGAFGIYNIWAASTMLYGALGYLIREWRILQTVMTLPGLLILPALWLIDESPRWLIVNGRTQEALQVFNKVARWHGVDLPPEEEMNKLVEEQAAEVQDTLQHSSLLMVLKSFAGEALVLFRTPRLRTITLCIYFNYVVGGMVFFGLSLSGATISDNPFIYIVLTGLMEIPAFCFTGSIVERFGRKSTVSVSLFITAIVLLAFAVIPAGYSITKVALAMIGKITITGGYHAVIFFSSELFPTEVRSRGIGTSFMMSRVGSMTSPFITDLVGSKYPWGPFVVFGSSALVAGALTFLLPETRGQVLPDTVADVEARARKRISGKDWGS